MDHSFWTTDDVTTELRSSLQKFVISDRVICSKCVTKGMCIEKLRIHCQVLRVRGGGHGRAWPIPTFNAQSKSQLSEDELHCCIFGIDID